MFTGIIEETGTLERTWRGRDSAVLRIRACKVLTDVKPGDSIAVNGVCLTVTSFDTVGKVVFGTKFPLPPPPQAVSKVDKAIKLIFKLFFIFLTPFFLLNFLINP